MFRKAESCIILFYFGVESCLTLNLSDIEQIISLLGSKVRAVSYNNSGSNGAETSLILFSVIIARSLILKGSKTKLNSNQ